MDLLRYPQPLNIPPVLAPVRGSHTDFVTPSTLCLTDCLNWLWQSSNLKLRNDDMTMPQRLAALKDTDILQLNEAAEILGLEPSYLEYLAASKAFGLKSKAIKWKRQFIVSDLRNFLEARAKGVTSG